MALERSDASEIAPRWHTALLVGLVASVAVTGTWLATRGASPAPATDAHSRLVAIYLPTILVEWGLVFYVCRVGRPKNALRSLLGKSWDGFARAGTDVALAAGVASSIVLLELACAQAFGAGRNATLSAELPRTFVEKLAWLLVAASAGFCEEVVYRGYLQRQFAAFTGSRAAAVAIQAVLFGVAHLEQGAPAAVRLAIYGALLGVLASSRQSLVPGILCHVAIDAASGLVGH